MDSNASRSDRCPGRGVELVGRFLVGREWCFQPPDHPRKVNGWNPQKIGGFEHMSPFPIGSISAFPAVSFLGE